VKQLSIALIVSSFLLAAPSIFGAEKEENDQPPCYLTDADLDKKFGVDEKDQALTEYVWVIYFHQVPVCGTCQLMVKFIYETIHEHFIEEVKGRRLVLRYRDFESEQNAALVKRLGIKSPSLVVSQIKNGKMVKAKLPGKIWSLAAEKEKFMAYVAKEIQSYFPPQSGD